MPNKLRSIKGVEIFASGVHNGDEYSERDLDEMVRAFEETGKTFRPALKLGHDDNQSLLQRDGLPAAGWVGAMYRKGKKLVADFIDIPDKIYDLLKRGAYKRVSCEVYWNAKVDGSDYRRLIGAVALLGADMPGVTCLSDIFQMYAADVGELHTYELDRKSFTIEIDKVDLAKPDEGAPQMTPEELKAKLEAEQQKNHALETDQKAKDEELATLRKYKADADAREIAQAKELAETKLEADVSALVASQKLTPAMKPYVKALLGEEKKEYAFGEKKFSKSELLKEILKLHSAKLTTVNDEECSVEGDEEGQEPTDAEAAADQKIRAYAKKHNCSYKDAYKAVMAEQESEESEDSEDEVDEE